MKTIALCGVIFIGTPPLFENDHYRYLWEGKVWAAYDNPYINAPASEELAHIDFEKNKIGYPQLTSIYPPVAQFIFYLTSPFSIKFGLILLQLLNFLVFLFLARKYFDKSRLNFSLISPFLCKEFIQSVHIDLLAAFFLVLALESKSLLKLASYIWLAFLTKILAVLCVPALLLRYHRSSMTFISCLGLMPVFLAVFIWLTNSADSGSERFIMSWVWNAGIYDLVSIFLRPDSARLTCLLIFLVLGGALTITSYKQSYYMGAVFLLFIILSPVIHPWYMIWPVLLLPSSTLIAFCALASSVAYMPYGNFSSYSQLGTYFFSCLLVLTLIRVILNKKKSFS